MRIRCSFLQARMDITIIDRLARVLCSDTRLFTAGINAYCVLNYAKNRPDVCQAMLCQRSAASRVTAASNTSPRK